MAEVKYTVFGVRHCYLVYNNTGVYGFKRCWYNKESEIKVTPGKLEFAGDGQKLARSYGYQAAGTIAVDIDDDTIDSIIWPIPKNTSPGGGDAWSTAYYHGTDLEMTPTFLMIWLSLDAQNADSGAAAVIRYNAFKALFDPEQPVKYASEAVGGRMLSFNLYRSTTDILGNTLTGVPTRGGFWRKEFITNSSNFDPVPGDIL